MTGKYEDPFMNMPLDLMMLVEVRCDALKKYRALSPDAKARADAACASSRGRVEKERVIDALERGEFS
ncbi:MAG: hypothetical protein IJQ80_03245 [Clostridia bacterium]|nr:hypothetical protein [Clostridia bacterium]